MFLTRRPDEIKCALKPLRGIGDQTIHFGMAISF